MSTWNWNEGNVISFIWFYFVQNGYDIYYVYIMYTSYVCVARTRYDVVPTNSIYVYVYVPIGRILCIDSIRTHKVMIYVIQSYGS